MDEDLVLLTSYFNLINGRRQESADTYRVDTSLPSNTSPDGEASLYIVTEASTAGNVGPRARRLAADTVAYQYSINADEQPAVRMRNAMRAAHNEVAREFDGHVTVGLSAIAVEANNIYLAQVAPALLYVVHEGGLRGLPATTPGTSPFARALGSRSGPKISVFRDEIGPEDILVVCSSWFHLNADDDDIRACFEGETAEEIGEAFYDLARQHDARDVSAIVIECVPRAQMREGGDRERSAGLFAQVDEAVQTLTGLGRMLVHELRPTDAPAATMRPRRSGDLDDELEPALPRDPVERDESTPRRGFRRPAARPARSAPTDTVEMPVIPPATENGFPETGIEDAYTWNPSAAVTPYDPVDDVPASTPYTAPLDAAWDRDDTDPTDPSPDDDALRHNRFAAQETHEMPIVRPDPEATRPPSSVPGGQPSYQSYAPDSPDVPDEPEYDAAPSLYDYPTATGYERQEPSGARPLDRYERADSVDVPSPASEDATAAGAEAAEQARQIRRREQRRRPRRIMRPQERQSRSHPEPEPDSATVTEMNEVNSRLQYEADMTDVIPPVQAFPDTSTEPSRIYATSKDIQAVNRRPRRFGGISRPARGDALSGAPVVRPGLGDLDLRQPVGRPAPPAVVWLSIAVVFLLVVVAGFEYYQHHKHSTAGPNYPVLVSKDLLLARAQKTPLLQDIYLNKARKNLGLARTNGFPAAQVAGLNTKLLNTTDDLHHVTRELTPVLEADFSKFPNANPTTMATGLSTTFVLDAGRKSVFSVPNSATLATAPTQIVQSGQTISGYTIGTPIQVTTSVSTPLIVDQHNTLIRGTGAPQNATSLVQSAQTTPVIAAITNTGLDVFELDTANSQVWRYGGAVNGSNPTPEAFFTPNGPKLNHAVSLVSDGASLYVLEADGTVQKSDMSANPQAFTVKLALPLKSPTCIFTDVGLPYVWIADPGTGRILQLDKSGNYNRTYTFARGDQQLTHLKSISVVGKTMYLLTGQKVYHFDLVP